MDNPELDGWEQASKGRLYRRPVPGGWLYVHFGVGCGEAPAMAFVREPAVDQAPAAVQQDVAGGDVCANCGHRTMYLSSGICSRCHQAASAALLGKLFRLHMDRDDDAVAIESLKAEVERLKGLNKEALVVMKEHPDLLDSKTMILDASRKRMHVAEHAVERIRTLLDVRENRNGWNDDRMAEILFDYNKGETGPDLDEQADGDGDGGDGQRVAPQARVEETYGMTPEKWHRRALEYQGKLYAVLNALDDGIKGIRCGKGLTVADAVPAIGKLRARVDQLELTLRNLRTKTEQAPDPEHILAGVRAVVDAVLAEGE